MRNPNGYGGVSRLPGHRTRPWRARVTDGWVQRDGLPPLQRYVTVGYFATRSEALVALAEFNRLPFNTSLKNITFREVFDLWSARYFERFPGTRRVSESAMSYCRPLWDLPMRELRTNHLQAVFDSMEGLSHAYQSKTRSLMHMLFEWCMKHDVLFRDYSEFVELGGYGERAEKRVFTPKEVRTLCQLAESNGYPPGEPSSYHGMHLIDTLPVLLYTGLRIGELLPMRKADVHLAERCIDVHGTKTKAARRLIPIHRDLAACLERVMARPGTLLFPDKAGNPLTYSRYKYSWFEKVMAALNMAHTPHETRHTFVSRMDSAGIPRSAQPYIAGHSLTPDVTDRYTPTSLPELTELLDRIDYSDD